MVNILTNICRATRSGTSDPLQFVQLTVDDVLNMPAIVPLTVDDPLSLHVIFQVMVNGILNVGCKNLSSGIPSNDGEWCS